MANGDAALAAGMDILDGTEDRREGYDEINKTRDYIAERTSDVLPVELGGTGATTADGARVNLDVVGHDEVGIGNSALPGLIPIYNDGGQLTTAYPSLNGHAASKQYTDVQSINAASARYRLGGTMDQSMSAANITARGHFYAPNASAATGGWTVAYFNSDGRIAKGSSSERYKKYISTIDPESLGDIWPDLVKYQMRNGDGMWKYGYIAERIAESEDLAEFAVHDAEGRPESIDFIMLSLVQAAELNVRVRRQEERIDDLERRLTALEGKG